jgi:hypothetical protein
MFHCHDLSLGLVTKAESATHESHLHSRECEGMNPYIPKWIPILGIGIPMESRIFKEVFLGV